MVHRVVLVIGAVGMLISAVNSATAATPSFATDDSGFRSKIRPFLAKYCVDCHSNDDPGGEFNIADDLTADVLSRDGRNHWLEVLNVLGGHEMPPKEADQPTAREVTAVVEWARAELVRAEKFKKSDVVVLRRMNRDEYQRTIRDLCGVAYEVDHFPQDPSSGGFDNNGRALSISPMQIEIYLEAAREILDRALVENPLPAGRPESIRWRFEVDEGDGDDHRVEIDNPFGDRPQRPIVHGARNPVENGFKVIHHASWDRNPNVRDFRLPVEGEYIVRVRAAGHTPNRTDVVESVKPMLQARLNDQMKNNPNGERWHHEAYERNLEHFQTSRIYNYGPPRLKLIQNMAGQPSIVDRYDVAASVDRPEIYETRIRATTDKIGLTVEYDYSIPREVENAWCQTGDDFARPELLVDWIEIEGPVYDDWPPSSHTRVMGPYKRIRNDSEAKTYVHGVLKSFMERAYRRPVTVGEVDEKVAIYDAARKTSDTPLSALKAAFSAILVSPHFLYAAEPLEVDTPLNSHQLASRLSYFLWSSMPDEDLIQATVDDRLTSDRELERQLERMLDDPKSEAFVTNFAGQWLGLRQVGANPPTPELYPKYDNHLETSIVQESLAFFEEVLRNDHDVNTFLKSRFVTINERLARFYGIDGVEGDEFREVAVDRTSKRGGLVTQAAVHTITSNGTRTSPVHRGLWILRTLLDQDPGLPVANVGDIAPKVPGIDKATVRQRLEAHRELPQCARCHSKIDPLGFALENYNAAGEWRDQEGQGYQGRIQKNDPMIDARAKLPDGTAVNGVTSLQAALLEREALFKTALTRKLFAYALGREMGLSDDALVEQTVIQWNRNGSNLKNLLKLVVTSDEFKKR